VHDFDVPQSFAANQRIEQRLRSGASGMNPDPVARPDQLYGFIGAHNHHP